MTRPLTPDIAARLREIAGARHVITDPDRLVAYESDGLTAYRVSPRAVVLPETTEQVSAVLQLLHPEGIEVIPRGAGTGLSGGALPTPDGVIVGTARMNRILSIDTQDRLARVQPGVINARLTEATEPFGLYYAPDPSSQSTCTLGGNVAENSGGPHCLKYGVTSRYVTGLTVVLAGGKVVRFGGAGREAVGGLDLVGLFVGSEGCFGIATEIEVRLLPVAQGVRTLLGIFDTMEAAGHAVTSIIASGLMPAAVEIVDKATIEAVEASVFAAGYPTDAGAALVIEFDGTEAGLDEDAERAATCCREAGAREIRRATSEAERTGLWKGRKKAFGAMGRIAPDLLVQDATVPRTRLPEVLARITELGEEYGLKIANVFHAGDGNLHPNILFDRQNSDELARVEKASHEIMALCVEAGGTITGEHGVGVDKRGYMTLVHNDVELDMLRRARWVFDPDGLLNPGKVVPDPVEAAAGGGVMNPGNGLADVLPPAALAAGDPEVTAGAEVEWSGRAPESIVRPGSDHEVAAVMEWACREKVGVVPFGSGRRTHPVRGTGRFIGLSTQRLSGISIYEPADLTITAASGTAFSTIDAALRANDQWGPFDPPGVFERTVGGLVACADTGPLWAGYGDLRNHVLGMTVVSGDGRTLRLGGRVVKNVAGFDLLKPMVGSHGSLGVITSLCLRAFPEPTEDRVLVTQGESVASLVEVAQLVGVAPILPVSVVLGDRMESLGDRAALIVRLHGAPATIDADQAALERHVGRPFEVLADAPGAAARSAVLEEMRDRSGRYAVQIEASVRPSRLSDFVEGLDRLDPESVIIDAYGGRARVGADVMDAVAVEAARESIERLGGALCVRRWSVVDERVSGTVPLGSVASAEEVDLTHRLEQIFDPEGVLWPSRL